ncbi:MAG: radical SAM protein [Candidatus Omnitrophota bacterium]|nr:radical SAM protein [Candidatus Omnitrophota bacterium]
MKDHEYAIFVIENKCNSKCNICWIEGADGALVDLHVISLSYFRKFLESIPKGRHSGVILSGGEVTLNEQLPEYASCARDYGYRNVMIQTNARALSDLRKAEVLKAAGVNQFFVSFHATDDDLSKRITGRTGAHAQTVRGLENLDKLGLTVITNTVMNSMNYAVLPEIGEFLLRFKNIIEMHFWGYVPMSLKGYELILPYALAAPYLNKTLKHLVNHHRGIRVRYFPVCLLDWPYKKFHQMQQPQCYGISRNFDARYQSCGFQKHPCCEGTDCAGLPEMYQGTMPGSWMPSVTPKDLG